MTHLQVDPPSYLKSPPLGGTLFPIFVVRRPRCPPASRMEEATRRSVRGLEPNDADWSGRRLAKQV